MSVAWGFLMEPEVLPFERLLPSRKLPPGYTRSAKYQQICASLQAVGLIEPLVVTQADLNGRHLVLDGHVRLEALRALDFTAAPCLIATDDEGYTYNNRINRLSTVQEHYMLRRALDKGVTPQRLAAALNVEVTSIRKRATLLEGICPEAVELLVDREFSPEVTRTLRKMKPTRQVECVEMMLDANQLVISYAKALLEATPASLLNETAQAKKKTGPSAEAMARLQREMDQVKDRYKLVEQSYGEDVLNLVLAKGYLQKLLDNAHVADFLSRHQPDILREFRTIVDTVSLEG
jgi:ParB-like chromosome segregation protein Spo0J